MPKLIKNYEISRCRDLKAAIALWQHFGAETPAILPVLCDVIFASVY